MRFRLLSVGTGLLMAIASLFGLPQAGQAQTFYVNPRGGVPYSGYSDPYYGGYGYSGVPYSYYNDGRHHLGRHNKLHWTRDAGLHWGRHYGRHHIGGHDFRYPQWY